MFDDHPDRKSPVTPGFFQPARPSGRSRLSDAMKLVASWPDRDREFFIQAFTTRKPSDQVAREMGMSVSTFAEERRALLRRFMRAAQPIAQ